MRRRLHDQVRGCPVVRDVLGNRAILLPDAWTADDPVMRMVGAASIDRATGRWWYGIDEETFGLLLFRALYDESAINEKQAAIVLAMATPEDRLLASQIVAAVRRPSG